MLNSISRPFVRFVEKYYPDPIIFATGLTFIAFIMVFIFTDASPLNAVIAWGDGFKNLMAFIGQLSFTLLSTTALANTRPVTRLLQRVAGLPKTEFGAYALAAFVTAIASLVAWALGLVAGAIIARHIQFRGQEKGLKLHYPLVVASAYSGFVVWHMGYSGSAQLFVATKGHALEKMIGVIPVTDTLFASYNLIGIVICLITIPILVGMMRPKEHVVGFSPTVMEEVRAELSASAEPAAETFGEKIERMRWISLLLGFMLVVYLAWHFSTKGLNLSLDIVNWTFLALGLILADSPIHYVKLVTGAGRTVGQIILQYPLYAGLMGLMIGTGLVKVMAGWFVAISTAKTLPFWTLISAGFINMFIPSGGGQWSVQGPVMIEAAKQLGTPIPVIVNAVAYGDQWTNMIQPFWTIPMLAIAGLKMRDMMGYTFITLIWTGIVFSFVLLVLV